MMKTLPLILLLCVFAFADNEMELHYRKNGCTSCHGMYGGGIGASPKLQGVREDILLRRLKDLQKGKTRTAFGAIMISFAKTLDENQTIQMAKYLSNLKKTVDDNRYEMEYDRAGDGGS